MESPRSKYNPKLIVAATVIVIIAVAMVANWIVVKVIIRQTLEAQITTILMWTVPLTIFVMNYFVRREKRMESRKIITKSFGVFMDSFLGGATYGTVMNTALTLLRGTFTQEFFSDRIYFLQFNSLDLWTIFGVSIFLLIYASTEVTEVAKDTFKVKRAAIVLDQNKVPVVVGKPTKND